MERIRVLRLIARLNIGGPAIQAIHLTSDLDPQRFDSKLATGHCAPGELEMTELLQKKNVNPIRIQGLGRAISFLDDSSAFWKIQKLIASFRPHIVHTHTAKAGALGRVAALLRSVPIRIHTFHGHVFHHYFSPFKSKIAIITERLLAKTCHHIIAISEQQKIELSEQYKIAPASKICLLPLGFDLSPFLAVSRNAVSSGTVRNEIAAPPDAILIGIIGRIAPIKNHSLFLESISLAYQQNKNIRAVIIGGGTEQELSYLQTLATQLGIIHNTHFLGYRTDLPALYNDLDIVALTSHNEGTPVALIEALACGKPCISTSVGGVSDVLLSGQLGKLVPPNDKRAFSNAILEVINHPLQRNQWKSLSPSSVETRYGMTRLLRDISSLYENSYQSLKATR